jgi:hypothetical protein
VGEFEVAIPGGIWVAIGDFRNALKSLGNETKVVIVAAGIEDAYNAPTCWTPLM